MQPPPSRCELLEHDQCVDVAERLVVECAGKPACHRKSQSLPKANGPRVCRDNEIELHRLEAHCEGLCLRMLAHQRGNAATLRRSSDNVATITYVCAQAWLIGLDEIGAEKSTLRLDRHESPCRHLD